MNASLLILTLGAILGGPALYAFARTQPRALSFLDGFIFVSISGLVLLDVLPETIEAGGLISGLCALAGVALPSVFERAMRRAQHLAHGAALLLSMFGMLLHHITDGAALSIAAQGPLMSPLALAVVIHSLPVGLLIWWLLYPSFGARLPALALLAMCSAAVAGFAFGPQIDHWAGARGIAWFQALVAGSLIHVVFGRPHLHGPEPMAPAPPADARAEGWGNLAGLVVVAALMGMAHAAPEAATAALPGTDPDHRHDSLGQVLRLAVASAPAALLLAALRFSERLRPWSGRFGPPASGQPLARTFSDLGGLGLPIVVAALLSPMLALALVIAQFLAAAALRAQASAQQARQDDRGFEAIAPWLVVSLPLAALALPLANTLPWGGVAVPLQAVGCLLLGATFGRCPLLCAPVMAAFVAHGAAEAAVLAMPLGAAMAQRRFRGLRPLLVLLATTALLVGIVAATGRDPGDAARWTRQTLQLMPSLGLILVGLAIAGSVLRMGGRNFVAPILPEHAHHPAPETPSWTTFVTEPQPQAQHPLLPEGLRPPRPSDPGHGHGGHRH